MNFPKSRFLLALILVLCLFCGAAQAATLVKDGMEISLEADQNAYDAGEKIELTLTVKNNGSSSVNLSSLAWELPEGVTAIQEKNGFDGRALSKNATWTKTLTFQVGKSAAAPSLPQTGDDSSLLLWGALLVLSAVGFAFLKPSARKRLLVLVMCVTLLGSMVPEISTAKAEEAEMPDVVVDPRLQNAGEQSLDGGVTPFEATRARLMEKAHEANENSSASENSWKRLEISEGMKVLGENVRIVISLNYTFGNVNVESKDASRLSSTLTNICNADVDGMLFSHTKVRDYGTHSGSSTVLPQSSHPYSNSTDTIYCLGGGSGTYGMATFFNNLCETESNYDGVFVYNGYGEFLTCRTGTTMRNLVVTSAGGGVFIRLYTDSSNCNYYGFKLDRIIPIKTPSISSLTLNSSGKPVIKWSKLYGFTGYTLQRAKVTNGTIGSYSTISSSYSSSATSYTDTSAAAGTRYAYRLRQTYQYSNITNETSYSAAKQITTSGVTLTAPKGITQRTTATGNVNLSWNAVANADGYEITMMTPNRDYYKLYGRTLSTNMTLKNLNAEFTWYKVKVRAFRMSNGSRVYGPYSNVFTGNPVTVRRLYVHEEYFNGTATPIPTATEDVALLRTIFQKASPFARRPILTNRYVNLSKSALKTRIAEMAALTDHNDVTVFYLSTHGDNSITSGSTAGMLYLSDGSWMKFSELASALKQIQGRVVVMMDSCGSGSSINKDTKGDYVDPATALIEAIAAVDEKLPADGDTIGEKTGELCLDKFYVIAASQGGRTSQFNANGSFLPMYLADAFLVNSYGNWQADQNGDNTITLGELGSYLIAYADMLESKYGGYYMHPQVYPDNSTFPIFRRRADAPDSTTPTPTPRPTVTPTPTPVTVTLGQPTNLSQTLTTAGKLKVSWSSVANATGYEVYYSTSSSGTYTKYGTTSAANVTLSNLPSAANKAAKLYVKVRAYRTSGGTTTYGAYSSVFTANPISVRALFVVEETFADGTSPLQFYNADVPRLNSMLSEGAPYSRPVIATYSYRSQSKSQLKSHIATMASLADSNDVTVFYLSTHGANNVTTGSQAGCLFLSDASWMTFGELATELKKIPGRVAIFVGSCGSGSAIGKSFEADFNTALINAIAAEDEQLVLGETGEKVGELCVSNKFYVITAAQGGRYGYGNSTQGHVLTRWMEQGLWSADTSGDNVITLAEMATYLTNKGNTTTINVSGGGTDTMHPQVYPDNSTFPLFGKF